ncbi:DUF305 domain-containing protein [Streptomyces sp. NPDC050504]|uniref:DUF305 domain-containing protein n=1 Tax=Streptomyces sp. NPDC050504 TaxID=3365618 RepID=UPI00378FF056
MTRTHWAAAIAVVLALLFAGAATVATAGEDGDGGSGAHAAHTPGEASADAGFARDMSDHHQQAVEMSFIVRDRTRDEEVRRLAYDIANTQANQRGMMLGWLDLWGLPKVSMSGAPMAWMGSGAASGSGSGSGPGSGAHSGHDMHGSSGAANGSAGGTTGSAGGAKGSAGGAKGSLMPGMATKAELARLRASSGRAAEVLYLQLMTDHHKGGVAMAEGCVRLCTVGVERELARGMVDAQRSELDLMAQMLVKRGAKPRG